MLRRHGAIERGDAMPVRVAIRMPQLTRDPLFEVFRNEMFQAFRFIVQFFNWIIEHLEKKRFNQTMMADNLERPFAPVLRKLDAMVALIFHQGRFRRSQALQHVGDRCGRQKKMVGQFF